MRSNFPSTAQKFDGREPDLKGHIYDLTTNRTPVLYINTTKENITFVGW
jgi:hypothetical protein